MCSTTGTGRGSRPAGIPTTVPRFLSSNRRVQLRTNIDLVRMLSSLNLSSKLSYAVTPTSCSGACMGEHLSERPTERPNWADYCDSMQSERWERRLDLVRRVRLLHESALRSAQPT